MPAIWILFALVMLKDGPHIEFTGFETQVKCEAAKADVIKRIIAETGSFTGKLTCFDSTPGTET